MLRVIGDEGRGIPLAVMMVWVEMLREDADTDIEEVAATMSDARVRSFHDPHSRAGKAMAGALGAEGERAWDVYLFFDPATNWMEDPPVPKGWVHQLSDAWADPARRRRNGQLEAELALLLASVARP